MLRVRDLHVSFQDTGASILQGVSFDIEDGAIVGLFGASGSGKTTLSLALLGLLPPSQYIVSGSVSLDGQELIGRPEPVLQRVRGARISIVFQDPALAL